jgi:hypothetical protein
VAEDLDYRMERALTQEIASLTEFIVRGSPDDYTDYMYQVGKIRGIQFAMDTLVELREKVEREEGF